MSSVRGIESFHCLSPKVDPLRFDRDSDQIPVYSIRKKLGLPLSSNQAEKACHLCLS